MNRSKEEVEKFFKEYVHGFIFTDIDRGIRSEMN